MQEKTLEEEYSDYLSSLPLQTLRTLGRRLGISAESRKSKPGCIQALIDLLTGKALPVPVSGKGAPVKHNYLDPSILRHLEDLRLERNKRNTTPPTHLRSARPIPQNLYEEPVYTGILEIMSGGYGFLRAKNCQPSANGAGDVFIAAPLIHSLKLREGDRVACTAKPSLKNESAAFQELLSVNGIPFGECEPRPQFETLTACYPEKRIPLSEKKGEFSLRVIDLFTPIGKGQRALVIAPKAGKTTLLKEIAVSCARMRPDVHLIVLLIDERPEEVTEFKRCVSDAEVIYSTFDEDAVHHTRAARLTIEHAKRYAEHGRDVVVLLDSLTRLTRAYNQVTESSGKRSRAGWTPRRLQNPNAFSERRATRRKRAASPSLQACSSKREAVWTTSFTKNSKERETATSCFRANFPSAASFLPSISTDRGLEKRSCCSRAKSWKPRGFSAKNTSQTIRLNSSIS